jgi:glycerophosphoryl diester phosphodiesterase
MLPYVNDVVISAHRGDRAYFPENTMPAFLSAIQKGADMIETDVHITADGESVIIHDHEVNGRRIHLYTYRELRRCKPDIVTLQEVLDLYADHPQLLLNLELKDFPEEIGELAMVSAKKALAMLDRHDMFARTVVNSVSGGMGEVNEWIWQTYGQAVRLHAYAQMVTPAGHPTSLYPTSYCSFCYLWPGRTQTQWIEEIRKLGLEAWACYGTDRAALIDEAVAAGAKVILTDDPAAVREMLIRKKLHR